MRVSFTEWLVCGGASWLLYLTLAASSLLLADYLLFEVEDHGEAIDCFLICNGVGRWGVVTPAILYVLVVMPSLVIYKLVHDHRMRRTMTTFIPVAVMALVLALVLVLWAAMPDYFYTSYTLFYLTGVFAVTALVRAVMAFRARGRKDDDIMIGGEEEETDYGEEVGPSVAEMVEVEIDMKSPTREDDNGVDRTVASPKLRNMLDAKLSDSDMLL